MNGESDIRCKTKAPGACYNEDLFYCKDHLFNDSIFSLEEGGTEVQDVTFNGVR